tara:strand:- start:293 stop:817 length:525 start_codon:yes stop_codon:yes gene_type:complete
MKWLETLRENFKVDTNFKIKFLIFADLLIVIDLVSKFIADDVLKTQTISVIDGFFNFALAYNTGVSFSMFNDVEGGAYILSAFAIIASTVLAALAIGTTRRVEVVGYGLIYAGALANGIDRVLNGHVIDFLDFYYKNWHYPTFNFADCFIFIGVAVLLLEGFFTKKEPKEAKSS